MRLLLALFHILWSNTNTRAKSVVLNQSYGGERLAERYQHEGPYYSASILPNDVVINKANLSPKYSLSTSETLGNFTQIMNEVTPTTPQSRRYTEINVTAVQERNIKPVLFFINRNSGGKEGASLIRVLRHLELHPLQIVDLRRERPSTRLKMFRNCSENVHILTAGGDGTMNWILDELSALNMTVGSFGVVPVGTGNDLYLEVLKNLYTKELERGVSKSELRAPITVRNLMFNPKSAIATHMQNMLGRETETDRSRDSPTVKLDRWRVRIKDRKVPKEIMDRDNFGYDYEYDGTGYEVLGESKENSVPEGQEVGEVKRRIIPGQRLALSAMRRGMSLRRKLRNLVRALAAKINPLRIIGKAARYRNMRMSNYMGFGVDGAVSLTLDNLRNYAPFLFVNSLTNKFWYGVRLVPDYIWDSERLVKVDDPLL